MIRANAGFRDETGTGSETHDDPCSPGNARNPCSAPCEFTTGTARVTLTKDDLAFIAEHIPKDAVKGQRYGEATMRMIDR
jgi:hypothetical protein